jgi:hypothetical protein
VLLALAIPLSLGPEAGLTDLIPGFDHVRSPYRFAVFAQLMLILLTTLGIDGLARHSTRGLLGAAVLAALAVAELRPGTTRLQPLPPLGTRAAWLEFLETQTAEQEAVAFLPFPAGRSAADYLGTAQWMYWQMRHGRPMVNGYSGFFPASYLKLKRAMRTFPDAGSLEALAEHGVRWAVVPRFVARRPMVEAAASEHHRLRWCFGDDANGIDVYALESLAP